MYGDRDAFKVEILLSFISQCVFFAYRVFVYKSFVHDYTNKKNRAKKIVMKEKCMFSPKVFNNALSTIYFMLQCMFLQKYDFIVCN